ncbi:MAG: trypsin-like serine protease [Archangium sp.]|nr:trypsin-like serine protease [Archangium sp.]MDP3570692.1 trypsin-like serine protease [Archangium sp.]
MSGQVGALVLALMIGANEKEDCDRADAGAALFILVDSSKSMGIARDTLKAALLKASDAGFNCVSPPIQIAFFGGHGLTQRTEVTEALCGADAGEVEWGENALPKKMPHEGNTPLAKPLNQVLERANRIEKSRRRLLFLATDGEPDCDALRQRDAGGGGTTLGKTKAQAAARKALAMVRVAGTFDFIWFVRVVPTRPTTFNIFGSPSDLETGREAEIISDGGTHLDLAELVNQQTKAWCSCDDGPTAPVVRRCEEDFPEAVLVGDERGFRCTGVVVGSNVVLTAAHCLPATVVGYGPSAASATRVSVVSSRRAPNGIDAALLFSAQDLPRSKIRSILVTPVPPSGPLLHVGYGAKNGVDFGKRRATTASARGWGCVDTALRRTGCKAESEMYLEGSPGHDTCAGDSGGPVWQREALGECIEDGVERSSSWRLIGVTSRSGEGATAQCGQGSIVTRVDLLMPWIRETTGLFLGEP